MRFIAVLSLLVIATGLLCAPVSAGGWGWVCLVYAGGQLSSSAGDFGADTSSLDGYDGNDALIVPGPTVYCATYHQNASDAGGWTGPTGFYKWDFIAPLASSVGSNYTWRFYVWADPAAFGSQIAMDICSPVDAPTNICGTVTLIGKPAGIDGGPAVGTVWDVNQPVIQTVLLPMFKSADGRNGYVFDFTTTVIPEPSSLTGLICGLAGVGGAVMKRRS